MYYTIEEPQIHYAQLKEPRTKEHIVWAHLYEMSRAANLLRQKVMQWLAKAREGRMEIGSNYKWAQVFFLGWCK